MGTVRPMDTADAPKEGQRLDTPDEGTRWLTIVFGLVVIGLGVGFLLGEVKHDSARWFLAAIVAGGLFVVWLGARYRRSYFTGGGLLRQGWTGREVVPWSRVVAIELDEIEAKGGDVGWVRLRLEPRRTIAIRVAPGRVGLRGRWIAEACPQAPIDDRRTGEITPPRAGAPAHRADRTTRALGRAARSHRLIAIGWIVGAAACVVVIVLVAVLRLSAHPVEAILTIVSMSIAILVASRKIRKRLALGRETRRVESPAD